MQQLILKQPTIDATAAMGQSQDPNAQKEILDQLTALANQLESLELSDNELKRIRSDLVGNYRNQVLLFRKSGELFDQLNRRIGDAELLKEQEATSAMVIKASENNVVLFDQLNSYCGIR